ncbi:hypothetical protein GCM10011491_34850 [Brucella endophytica]|uniref:Uncharacterized protein n=1 Tax=Brucella endophytica TaxID=1963359 RepID=A0A916SLQ8_9HYPH|nr:hypothetical protein GCM10011491_34850 [Brucella endophytica]
MKGKRNEKGTFWDGWRAGVGDGFGIGGLGASVGHGSDIDGVLRRAGVAGRGAGGPSSTEQVLKYNLQLAVFIQGIAFSC